MKRKGFTLIELLAVIVILAVIALITTTVIIKVVENSRKNAAKNSALNYLDAVEKYVMYHDVDDTKYPEEIKPNSLYQISNKEYTLPDGKTAVENKNLNEILGNTIKGEKPDTGIVEFDEKRKVVSAVMIVNNYNVTCTSSTDCIVEGKDTDPTPILSIGSVTSDNTSITIPYTIDIEKGSVTVECVYGTDTKYGHKGVINEENNTCTLSNLTSGTTYYFKLTPKSDKNKKGKSQTSNVTTLNYIPSTEFKVGDYVKMTPSYEGEYTPTTDSSSPYYTGTNTPGSVTPRELDTWVVIRKNDDGTIEMVSKYVSSGEITFYGQTGVDNLVGALNKIAEQYKNDKFTSDSRYVGYDKNCSLEKTSGWAKDTCYVTDAELLKNSNQLLGYTKDESVILYALASKTYGSACTGLRNYWFMVDGSGEIVEYVLYGCTTCCGFQYSSSTNIRPILTLKPDVVADPSGDGSKEHPWVLVEP